MKSNLSSFCKTPPGLALAVSTTSSPTNLHLILSNHSGYLVPSTWNAPNSRPWEVMLLQFFEFSVHVSSSISFQRSSLTHTILAHFFIQLFNSWYFIYWFIYCHTSIVLLKQVTYVSYSLFYPHFLEQCLALCWFSMHSYLLIEWLVLKFLLKT